MRKSRFSEAQIMVVLKQEEGGMGLAEPCRQHSISTETLYNWRAKFGGMDTSMNADMRVMEDENRRLKWMFAELSLQNELLKDALAKK